MSTARVINGTIVPDIQSVLTVLTYAVNELKADPTKMARFKSDPRQYLGGLGLNADIQREALAEAGLQSVDAAAEVADNTCSLTCGHSCNVSCACTDCCLTCWFSVW